LTVSAIDTEQITIDSLTLCTVGSGLILTPAASIRSKIGIGCGTVTTVCDFTRYVVCIFYTSASMETVIIATFEFHLVTKRSIEAIRTNTSLKVILALW